MSKYFYPFLFLLIILSSCTRDEINADYKNSDQFKSQIPLTWNKFYLEIERFTSGYRPPVSARSIAYINLAAYESIVGGSNGKYKSLSTHYPDLVLPAAGDLTAYDWEVVLSSTYERSFELFFPIAPSNEQFKMLQLGSDLRERMQIRCTPEVFRKSVEYGEAVAQAVFAWSETDFWGDKAFLKNNDPNYKPPQGEFLWKPTYPDYAPALLPHWGKVRTFSRSENVWAIVPPAVDKGKNSSFYAETKEVWQMVNNIKAGGLKEDKWIAEFWSDDCPILTFSPAARWISITNQILSIENLNLMESVVAYAKVSMALSDAGVRCWAEKYRYNYLRPIDYIRQFMEDQEWNTIMCPDGSGGFYTPPFPTYPSGHASFSSAASVILASIFGDNYRFTDRSHEGRTEFNGTPRTFYSFREMALENGYSRLPLGVHFRFDAEGGYDLGNRIGNRVLDLPWK